MILLSSTQVISLGDPDTTAPHGGPAAGGGREEAGGGPSPPRRIGPPAPAHHRLPHQGSPARSSPGWGPRPAALHLVRNVQSELRVRGRAVWRLDPSTAVAPGAGEETRAKTRFQVSFVLVLPVLQTAHFESRSFGQFFLMPDLSKF